MLKPSTEFQKRFDPKIWEIVKNIPAGQVMSYGMIAERAGYPKYPRMVSPAMERCSEKLPWYRVVRSNHTLALEVFHLIYLVKKLIQIVWLSFFYVLSHY